METGYEQKSGKGAAVAAVLVLLMLVAFCISFIAFGGLERLPIVAEKPPPGWQAAGQVAALRLAPPPAQTDVATLRAYYKEAIEYAQAGGFNTLVFEAKQETAVWWRDAIFPPVPGLAQQDENSFNKYDPLAILCEELEGREVQLWVAVNPYAEGGVDPEGKSRVEKLAQKRGYGTTAAFAANDDEYNQLLADSVARLPVRYPIAGIVFTGFEANGWRQASRESIQGNFPAVLRDVNTFLAKQGRQVPLALAYADDAASLIPAQAATALLQEGAVDYLMPQIRSGPGLAARLAPYAGLEKGLVVAPPLADTSGLFLFTAHQSPAFSGVLWGGWQEVRQNQPWLGMQESALRNLGTPLPQGFEAPQVLDITYPAEDRTLTWEGVYITGHSNPGSPLTLDGVEVQGRAANGAFGVFVPLQMGDNSFTFQNGEVSAVKTIKRVAPPESGTAAVPYSDGTVELQPGQAVRLVSPFTSALTTYNDIYSVNEIFGQGSVAVVQQSRQFQNGRYLSWSYQLTSGDWVWASVAQPIAGDGKSAFTGLAVQPHEKGEYLMFEGTGTPAAYIAYEEDTGILKLTMYDTSMSLPEGFTSEFVTSAWVEPMENGVVLNLQTNSIWGYNIEYADGQTRLFIKRPPSINQADPTQPLLGVHVMLDPGHGAATEGSNYGAVGIAGETGYPHEKDINLALAQATAYRLRQLGATVTFTREDDTNPGINQRFAMQLEEKPDFFLSIHHDGLDGNVDLSDKALLLGIYYHPYNIPPSRGFAGNLLAEVAEATGRQAEEKPRWGSVNYGVIRTTVCPSVLFEYGLIVQPDHYFGATSTEGIYEEAFATAEAVLKTIPGWQQ